MRLCSPCQLCNGKIVSMLDIGRRVKISPFLNASDCINLTGSTSLAWTRSHALSLLMTYGKVILLLFSMGEGCFTLSRHFEEQEETANDLLTGHYTLLHAFTKQLCTRPCRYIYHTQVFSIRQEVNRAIILLNPIEPQPTSQLELLPVCYF